MPADQRMAYIQGKIDQRQSVRRRMAGVIAQRHAYLQAEMMKELGSDAPNVFGQALTQALVEQASERGLTFGETLTQAN